MIPFPGESQLIASATPLPTTNYGLRSNIVIRGSSGGNAPTATLDPGERWAVWFEPDDLDYRDPTDTTPVDVAFVVEILSGTGTLTASWGFDPEYGDTTLVPGNSLGTHTVTGPTTLVLPTGMTLADYKGDHQHLLHLVGDSGAIEVQQVKLRVWPTTGALGGFGEERPGFDTTENTPFARTTTVNKGGAAEEVGLEPSWDTAADELVTSDANPPSAPYEFTINYDGTGDAFRPSHPPGHYVAGQIVSGLPDTIGTDIFLVSTVALIYGGDPAAEFPVDPSLTDGVDYIRPPNEVQGDWAVLVQREGTGSCVWHHAFAAITQEATDVPLGNVVVDAENLDAAPTVPGVSNQLNLPARFTGTQISPADLPVGTGKLDVFPLPTTSHLIAVYTSHTAATTPPEHPGSGASIFGGPVIGVPNWGVNLGEGDPASEDFQGIRYHLSLPAYRVWDPTAAVATRQPHLIFQRGDNLGAGAALVYQPATRQSTGLVYGNH